MEAAATGGDISFLLNGQQIVSTPCTPPPANQATNDTKMLHYHLLLAVDATWGWPCAEDSPAKEKSGGRQNQSNN